MFLFFHPDFIFSMTLTTQTQEGRRSLPSIDDTDTGQEAGE